MPTSWSAWPRAWGCLVQASWTASRVLKKRFRSAKPSVCATWANCAADDRNLLHGRIPSALPRTSTPRLDLPLPSNPLSYRFPRPLQVTSLTTPVSSLIRRLELRRHGTRRPWPCGEAVEPVEISLIPALAYLPLFRLPPATDQPSFFSTRFRLLATKCLCFHAHSRLLSKVSTVVLCFHRHSRIVLSFLKNSFLLPLSRETSCLGSGEPICRLFVAPGTFSQVGWGKQQHSA